MGLILYADDGKSVVIASNVLSCYNNQTDFDAIYRWAASNRLPLNLAKFQCLHIGYGNPNYVSTLRGQPILVVEQCTDLGLIRTNKFSYSAHINSAICKTSLSLASFSKCFRPVIKPSSKNYTLHKSDLSWSMYLLSGTHNAVLL